MKIRDEITLRELQDDFRSEFPFLKLEFFKYPHTEAEGSNEIQRVNENLLVGQVRQVHNSGHINLDPRLKTGALEQTFRNIFGLNVQVYRKSYGQWVQTCTSDEWSLKEQNLRSMRSEERIRIV